MMLMIVPRMWWKNKKEKSPITAHKPRDVES